MELAGVATIVAVLPGATETGIMAMVDAMPPLILTEHQLSKFRTVSVTPPPPSDVPPSEPLSTGVEPESVTPLDDPLELPLDEPLELPLDDPLELPLEDPELDPLLDEVDPPLEPVPPLELLPPSPFDGVPGELSSLLQAKAPAAARTPMPANVSKRIRFIVLIMKPPWDADPCGPAKPGRLPRQLVRSVRTALAARPIIIALWALLESGDLLRCERREARPPPARADRNRAAARASRARDA
jgi:hypothetical protein